MRQEPAVPADEFEEMVAEHAAIWTAILEERVAGLEAELAKTREALQSYVDLHDAEEELQSGYDECRCPCCEQARAALAGGENGEAPPNCRKRPDGARGVRGMVGSDFKELISDSNNGGGILLHHDCERCKGCGAVVSAEPLTKLVYTFEACHCDESATPHLIETLWHRWCFVQHEGPGI